MRKALVFGLITLIANQVFGQVKNDSNYIPRVNSAQTLIASKDGNLLMAAYGEVHFNQPFGSNTRNNGMLDVHRQVLLFGYRFNKKTSFITEIEIEHIKEVYLEQAFLNHEIKPWLNFQAGLMLIPMGIVNEYHEPTVFNGVERPVIDNVLVPTTWREIGAGFAGNLTNIGLRYQLYAVNGPLGYDGEGQLNGAKPIRGARQKGSQVTMSHPDFAGKLTYFGVKGLDIGLAAYIGQTESSLFNNLSLDSTHLVAQADSSSVGVQMVGLDFRYQLKKFQARGQWIMLNLTNTNQYNGLVGSNLGTSAYGYYLEAGYDVSSWFKLKQRLVPFVRYSSYNTHASVNEGQGVNAAFQNDIVTTGLSYFLTNSMVLKADYQRIEDGNNKVRNTVNAGLGYWFR